MPSDSLQRPCIYKKKRGNLYLACPMVRGLRTTFRNRTSSLQKPTQLCMYTMATHAFRQAEWRTSTHGRYKPRASYRCLVPDSDIEMCEVSYHQEQASINALNKKFCPYTALLPRHQNTRPTTPTCCGLRACEYLAQI